MKNKNRYLSVCVCVFINIKDGRFELGFVIKDYLDYGVLK